MAAMDLDAAVDELYGLAPEDFLTRRKALVAAAKSAADPDLAREITALRKPTVAAWAVTLLARRRPEELDRLAELAEDLRAAQRDLDGPEMTRLGRERNALVTPTASNRSRLRSSLIRRTSPVQDVAWAKGLRPRLA